MSIPYRKGGEPRELGRPPGNRGEPRRSCSAWSAATCAFRRSIRVRFGFALAFALIGITLTAAVWKASEHMLLSTFEQSVHEVRGDMTPSHNIAVSLLEAERLVRLYEKEHDGKAADDFELIASGIEWNFVRLIGHLSGPERHADAAEMAPIASAYEAWKEARGAAKELFASGPSAPGFATAFGETLAAMNAAYNGTSEFYRRTVSSIELRLTEGQTFSRRVSYFMMSAIAAGFAILILTGFYVSRSILQPIGLLREAALKLGEKDLSYRVRLRNPEDELGQLGSAFNAAAASLEELYRDLEHRSTYDGLTGAHNRATFEERLEAECHGADRHMRPLALLMIDLDHFKAINDTHGHQTGDLILKRVGRILADVTRAEDMVARYGGEEFAVIMAETNEALAVATAERLRREVMQQASGFVDSGRVEVAVSIGVACRQPHEMSPKELVKAADAALYRAKRSGRNRVESGREVVALTPLKRATSPAA